MYLILKPLVDFDVFFQLRRALKVVFSLEKFCHKNANDSGIRTLPAMASLATLGVTTSELDN
jgi:hypothetical protein